MNEYHVYLMTPDWIVQDCLSEIISLRFTRRVNHYGAVELVLPASWNWRLVRLDSRVSVWRRGERGSEIEEVYFIRKIERLWDQGREQILLSGPSLGEILERRIVAWPAGSSRAEKKGPADDIIREVVRENLGLSAVNIRRVSWLTVEPNRSEAALVETRFAWRNVLDALRHVVDAARSQGQLLWFGVEPREHGGLFQVRKGCWGRDRRQTSGNPYAVSVGPAFGNVEYISFAEDHGTEKTYVYAGGAGEEDQRMIVEVGDEVRARASSDNRVETFFDGRNYTTSGHLTNAARATLNKGRPFCGARKLQLRDYCGSWSLGDFLTVQFEEQILDVVVSGVDIEWSAEGERVRAKVEAIS